MADLILGFSDQHLRDTGSFVPYNQTAPNGLSKELNNMLLGWEFVAQMIREYRPKLVHNFGDTINCTEFQSVQVIHGMYLAHEMILKACQEVGAILTLHAGNHDVFSEQHGINNINILSPYYSGGVYLEPTVFEGLSDFRIGIIPYSSNQEKLAHYFEHYQNKCDVLFAHVDLAGAFYESGTQSESNLVYSEEGIPLISGDLHNPQCIHSNLYYVGSLVQHRFFYENLDHVGGVILMDMQSQKMKWVPNTLSKHYIKVRDSNLQSALGLDPKRCVFQVFSSQSKEEIDALFQGRTYHYSPEIRSSSRSQNHCVDFTVQEPHLVLRSWVSKDRPSALAEFDQIFS